MLQWKQPQKIRIKEAAEILGVSPATVRNMIARGEIKTAGKITQAKNSPFLVARAEIEALASRWSAAHE